MLSLDDEDFARKFSEAIGAQPGDTIQIATPHFERTDGVVPALPDAWERLRTLSVETLAALGCGRWDAPDERGTVLMLFPKEWYAHIPAGFEIVTISGNKERFVPGKTDDDYRFGCLAYGIRAALAAAEGQS